MQLPTLKEVNEFLLSASAAAQAGGYTLDLVGEAAEHFGVTKDKIIALGGKLAKKMNNQKGGYTVNTDGTSFSLPKPEVITKGKPSPSTRKDDNMFKKARREGDEAILNTVRSRATTLSLGRSISFNNNAILSEMLNRRTTISVSGGYHYNAEVGKRAWHMQHFRHNAYNDSAADYGAYKYAALPISETRDAVNSISLINPTLTEVTEHPGRSTAFKPVNVYSDGNGGTDQYAPFSIVDLENCSYRLQGGKSLLNAITFADSEDSATGHNGWVAGHVLMPRNKFASRSHIYQHNQYVGDQVVPSTSHPVVDNLVKCKPCLLGGKVEYLFMNTGTAPASVTVVVYKVKQSWIPNEDNPNTFGYLRRKMLEAIKQAYLDKGFKLRLKTMGGRVPVESDVTDNAQFQFLPNVKPVIASAMPYTEEMRYSVVVAAGQTKNISITLPGRMYDPTSTNRSRILVDPSTSNNKIDGTTQTDTLPCRPLFYSKEQYSVAVGVAGCPAVQNFHLSTATDASGDVREGVTTTAANVTCRVKYTERIAAMNMQLKSKPTIGADTFDPPNADSYASTNVTTVALVPVQDVSRTAPASGVMPL